MTETSIVIAWRTSAETSGSEVDYGLTPSYGNTVSDPSTGNDLSVSLSN